MDCMTARLARYKNNREKLLGLAKELKEKHGCEIYCSSDLFEDRGSLIYFEARKMVVPP